MKPYGLRFYGEEAGGLLYRPQFQRAIPMISEDQPTYQSMGKNRQFGYNAKRSTEPYKEARKYLASRVGDEWNKIWADICSANVPRDKARIFNYIREQSHLVYLNCFQKEDGGIYTISDYVSEMRVDKEISYGWRNTHRLYVYNGILCKTIFEKYIRPKEQKVVKFNNQEFVQKDEIWYRVILKPNVFPKYSLGYFGGYDTLRKKRISNSDGYRFYGRNDVYCFAHYPLKNKELKALKNFLKEQSNGQKDC